jgi:hypothetical protein
MHYQEEGSSNWAVNPQDRMFAMCNVFCRAGANLTLRSEMCAELTEIQFRGTTEFIHIDVLTIFSLKSTGTENILKYEYSQNAIIKTK